MSAQLEKCMRIVVSEHDHADANRGGGCNFWKKDRRDSPTGPALNVFQLGNYAQQEGQSRIVTVNGETHQINGMVSGSVVPDGLYFEINEQQSVGSLPGTDQIAVSVRDAKITFTGLPSGVSAIKVFSNGVEFGEYATSNGAVEIALTYAQWTQWFGPTHYAVSCAAVGDGRLNETMAAVSGRLPSGEVVTFGKGFGSVSSGNACPTCPACPPQPVTCNANDPAKLVDNGNGTVTDLCTGLIWLKNMGCAPAQGLAAHMVWAANLANGQCNLTDGSQAGQWRLPTLPELTSLLDYSHNSIPDVLPLGHPFTNVQTRSYWSSTAKSSSYGWGVRLGNGWGEVAFQDKGNNGNALAVR